MQRLYFLLPNPVTTCQVVADLEGAGVRPDHMHAVATHMAELDCVHQATILQTSQVGRGAGLGLLVGGLAGLLGGWLAITFPPPNLAIGMRALAICAAIGAILGAIVGGVVAQDRLNPEILPYEGAILRGTVLLMVDVSREEVESVTALVQQHHPEALSRIAAAHQTQATAPA